MKNKSFLFLIVALALGLALLGCSSDSDGSTEYITVNQGYASQIEAINAAFAAGASTVKLVGETKFVDEDDPLIIPDGKILDLDGFNLLDDGKGKIIVAEGSIDFSKGGNVILTGESYFLAQSAFISDDGNVGTDTTYNVQVGDTGSASVVGTLAVSGAVVSFTGSTLPATGDDRYAALAAGSTGIILFSPSLTTPLVVGDNPLYVTGKLELSHAGTVSNSGTLVVTGAVKSTATDAGTVVVSGELKAKSLDSAGGQFGGTVTLTDPTATAANNVLAGSFVGGLTSEGAATIKGDVYFELPSEIKGAVTVNDDDINLWGEGGLTVNGATVGKKLTIGGTLTTKGNVTLGSGNTGSIVLDAQGGFKIDGTTATFTAGTAYTLAGAGSISNGLSDPGVGSLITLNATGLASSGGTAGGTPTLVFASDSGITLSFLSSGQTITDLNLDLTGNGTIGVHETLVLTGAGSITAGNIAYAGTIAGTLAAGGSLLVGSMSAGDSDAIPSGSITAGSIGLQTSNPGIIVSSNVFAYTDASVSGGIGNTGVGDGGSASAGGSILVFDHQ